MTDKELIRQTVEMPLTNGGVTLVDSDDVPAVQQFKWRADKRPHTTYVQGWVKKGGKWSKVYLHRFILGVSDRRTDVDHRDDNGLNNSRSNLRTATRSQNLHRRRIKNKTGFRGVVFQSNRQPTPWQAQISIAGVPTNIGRFETAQLAALAYDEFARKYFGEFARTNFSA